jgi:antitoxin VapB
MNTAKIFPNGRSQAVRLPKEFQFSTEEVYINRIGNMVVLFPCDKGWEVLARSVDGFTKDFMADRDQGDDAEERAGL